MADPAGTFVTADARYLGAWGEMQQRIGQRQNLISVYALFASVIFGRLTIGANDAITTDMTRLVYAIPILTLVVVALIDMHDMQIALLRSFLADLEAGSSTLPGHHGPNHARVHEAQRIRKTNDLAIVSLILLMNLIAGLVFFRGWSQVGPLDRYFIAPLLACLTAASIYRLATTDARRGRMYEKFISKPPQLPTP